MLQTATMRKMFLDVACRKVISKSSDVWALVWPPHLDCSSQEADLGKLG